MTYKLTDPKTIEQMESVSEIRDDQQRALDLMNDKLMELHALWKLGVLSFDPAPVMKLSEQQRAEVLFVGSLLQANVQLHKIEDLVVGLDRPLAYPVERMHYDWASHRWYQLEEAPTDLDLLECVAQLAEQKDIDGLRMVAVAASSALAEIAGALVEGLEPPRASTAGSPGVSRTQEPSARKEPRGKRVATRATANDATSRTPDPPTKTRAGQYGVVYKGRWYPAENASRAMLRAVQLLADTHPGFLEQFSDATQGRKRRFVARKRSELYPGDPRACEKRSLAVRPGWFMGTNYSRERFMKFIEMACEVVGRPYGADLTVQMGEE